MRFLWGFRLSLYHQLKITLYMRVLIVNTSDKKGGAAVAAHRLTEALIKNGVKVRMMVMEKNTDALYVSETGSRVLNEFRFVWERIVIWVNNLLSRRHLFAVSIANTGIDITKTQEFREADIIHLHWINQGMLSLKDIQKILTSGKPVVWTMHDMWPLTAICHYAHECNRFTTSCGKCPFLKLRWSNDLSRRVFHRKQRMLDGQHICYVAVSSWLARNAQASALLQGQRIETIPNTLTCDKFTLIPQAEARKKLSIKEKHVVVFGAARIDYPIKGFSYLCEALQILISQKDFKREDILLILFGGIKDEGILKTLPTPYLYMGYQKSEQALSEIYSAADALVSSSKYETFGQTLIEAQACGCLPVSFDGSGQADIIRHQENGYLARRLSAESLAEGLQWAFTQDHSEEKRASLRSEVIRRYSGDVIASKYIKLYEQLSRKEV